MESNLSNVLLESQALGLLVGFCMFLETEAECLEREEKREKSNRKAQKQ